MPPLSVEERLARAEAAIVELDLRAQVAPGKFAWNGSTRPNLNSLQQERDGRLEAEHQADLARIGAGRS